MNIDSFVHFIRENYSPNGIVFSTEKAKNIISKNNLTPAEFLRPFGFFPKITFNTEISSFIISDFYLDFYDSEFYHKIPESEYSTIINRVLRSQKYSPKIHDINFNNIFENSKIKLTDRIIDKLKDFSFPWFSAYIKTIIELTKFNESELFQQPLCFIYICSIDDPVDIVKPKLTDKEKIPTLIYERIYTPDMPTLIIIINDKSGEKQITVEEKNKYINGFKNLYKNYYLLYWELNDISNGNIKDLDESIVKYYSGDIWSKYEHMLEKYYYNYDKEIENKNNPEKNIKGKLISIYSRRRFHQTLNDFFIKYALENIELKMKSIERKVLESKKGLKNTIFSFFKQDNSEDIYLNTTYHIYSLTNTEFHEYFYATLCFYFKDYKQAKDISSIFMNDIKKKSPEHYNAAFELNKLSYFLYNYYNKKNGLEYNEFYKDEDAFETFSNYIKNEYYFEACRALFSGMKIHEQNLTILQLTSILTDVAPYIPGLPSKDDNFCVSHFYPLINEQIAVYFSIVEPLKKRKFLWFIFQAAIRYKKESSYNKSKYLTKYAINDFLLMSDFLNKNDKKSFLMTKYFIFEQMENLFKEENNEQGLAISYLKNIINYINLSDKKKILYSQNIQNKYNYLINILLSIKVNQHNEDILNDNNFLNNIPFPEIDNSSILIVEEQDIIINNAYKAENINSSNWKYFDKYDYIPYHKNFLCLTPPDVQALVNLDNIIQNKQNFSNFFSKRRFNININKKIYVSFIMSNPLPIDLNITKIKLICEFKSEKELLGDSEIEKTIDTIDKINLDEEKKKEIIYEEKELILSGYNSNLIQLYVQGNKIGRIIIKGVEIIIENCINVKHYFNKKKKLDLYQYKRKIKKSNSIDLGITESLNTENKKSTRKGSISSQHSNKSRDSNNSYKPQHKYKEAITCDIKDNNNDVNISFPYGTELKLYKYQLFFMPIKIANNSNIKIKQFCFYLSDDSKGIEQSCILSELIFKEIEISNNKENKNNEKIIYVPLLPKKEGKTLLKILFKFEEDKVMSDYEIQRFIVVLDVHDSFSVNIKEIVRKYDSNSILADLDLLCSFYNNNFPLEKIIINTKLYFNNIYEQANMQKNTIEENKINDISTMLYNKYKIKKKIKNDFIKTKNEKNENKTKKDEKSNKRIKELLQNINFDFLDEYDFINYDKMQSHIKHHFCKLLLNDFLIFNWSAKERNTNKNINGIFIYKPKLIFTLSLSNFINNLLTMKYHIHKINEITICTIDILIDNNYYNQLDNVKGIEIFINKDKHNFDKVKWFGLEKYKINKINSNSNKEKEIHFSCLISEKGIYDINQISLLAHFYFSRNEKKIFNKILSPIIVKID